jgi:predicted SprT family Zn-dependent metalloprotease
MRGGKPPVALEGTKNPLTASRRKSSVLPSEADLQLIFARLNYEHFNGEAPDCKIAYNARFSNSAGRISYSCRPLLIELSPKHFRARPEALEETLVHEMIHAWCFAKFKETGHGARFKRKLRECGLGSIYHDMGSVRPLRESSKRYVLRCEGCGFEALRKSLPSRPSSCPRCNKRRFDPRFPLTIYELVELRAIGTTTETRTAARRGRA